jgi:Tfp pilus assembly protein PilF
MRSSRLRSLIQRLFVLAGITASGGCATMGGNMANSSGMGYYEQGNYVAAASEFQTAAMNDPSNPDFIANLAKARMKMGDAAGSEQLYRQALTIAPSHQPSYHGLAELMMAQGRGQDAQAMMTTWSATQPYVAESHVELAWLQREMGQTDAAAQSLQKALEVNPSHATALAHMGQYYEEIGRPDQAVAMYQHSLSSDWNQPEVHSRIAAASQSAGSASPMAATAMARGVHPYNIPRRQTAFGPPSPGAQRAQMQMAGSQMAMAGNPMVGQMLPGPMSNQMAMSPNMNQGVMSAQHAPSGWQQSPSQMPAPTSWASFGTSAPQLNQPADPTSWPAESAMPEEALFDLKSTPSPETALAPTPDPAFSAAVSSTPATQISWTQSRTPDTATASNEPPLVDAF